MVFGMVPGGRRSHYTLSQKGKFRLATLRKKRSINGNYERFLPKRR
jgi:hypothetical protein